MPDFADSSLPRCSRPLTPSRRPQVEFHADGFNHFVSKQYPAHAHWAMDGDRVTIHWGSYGDFELTIDAAGTAMAGHKAGQPASWRRATFLRSLGAAGLASAPDHGHDH